MHMMLAAAALSVTANQIKGLQQPAACAHRPAQVHTSRESNMVADLEGEIVVHMKKVDYLC